MDETEYREAVERAAWYIADAWNHGDAGCSGDERLSMERACVEVEALKEGGGDWKKARSEAWDRAVEIYSGE